MFDENILQPFDKVLVRDFLSDNWMTDFFEKIEENDVHYNVTCVTTHWIQCIPTTKKPSIYLGQERIVLITINGGRTSYDRERINRISKKEFNR